MIPRLIAPAGVLLVLGLLLPNAIPASLSYYLPENVEYDAAIAKPSESLGYEVGDWHVRHDQMTAYLKQLAAASDRIQIEVTGHTYEQRELLLLTISSPSNLSQIDSIRERHLQLSDPDADLGSVGDQPVVLYMGYSVHGDESSAGNAALLVAYHLAAAQGPDIDNLLSNAIILLDPCLNPDGFNRFAQWANSHRGKHPVGDAHHREHLAVWPAGRGNHYWFDLNRDWLLLQHPESRARIRQFHRWKPNIHTDFHEMSSSATYFFQPGVPERRNPLTPVRNVLLTEAIAEHHADALDAIGSLYYTEERFDDYYYGKGSTYPDINGGIGILFEQASTRGHVHESPQGEIDFPFTIRNQFRTSLSTFEAAMENRNVLLEHQRDFYRNSQDDAREHAVQAYVFGDPEDPVKNWKLLEILRLHDIRVHALNEPVVVNDRRFQPGSAWIVPMQQPQYRLARTIFEVQDDFPDNIFYDVSAWTFPLAMGIPSQAMEDLSEEAIGDQADSFPFPKAGAPVIGNAYAYGFEWNHFYSPRALHRLLDADVRVRVATRPLKTNSDSGMEFRRGSIIVPMGIQETDSERIHEIFRTITSEDGVPVHPISSGLTPAGIDLGSPSLMALEKPKPLLLVGSGVSAYQAGEVWHLLDRRFDVPVTLVEHDRFNRLDLHEYTHLILVGGAGSRVPNSGKEDLRRWLQAGGVLIAIGNSARWAAENGFIEATFKSDDDSGESGSPADTESGDPEETEERDDGRLDYGDYEKIEHAKQLSGAFFRVDLDHTHPIGYGHTERTQAVFRSNRIYLHPSENPYATVSLYAGDPWLSGYVHEEELKKLSRTASVIADKQGDGTVVLMVDNPNFRAYTYGPMKLFLNALFFGRIVQDTD